MQYVELTSGRQEEKYVTYSRPVFLTILSKRYKEGSFCSTKTCRSKYKIMKDVRISYDKKIPPTFQKNMFIQNPTKNLANALEG